MFWRPELGGRVRCARCGNQNDEGNRFCGMCGSPLIATNQPAPPAKAAPIAPNISTTVQKPVSSASRSSNTPSAFDRLTNTTLEGRSGRLPALEQKREPVISGPSFLGLNKPGSGLDAGTQAGGADDRLRPSGDLDYLLDDEEEPKHGWGKFLLILVALALATGFGYLRWKQGGFAWLNLSGNKPALSASQNSPRNASAENGNGAASGAAPAAGGAASAGPSSDSPPSGTPPPNDTGAPPGTATPSANATSPATPPPGNAPAPSVSPAAPASPPAQPTSPPADSGQSSSAQTNPSTAQTGPDQGNSATPPGSADSGSPNPSSGDASEAAPAAEPPKPAPHAANTPKAPPTRPSPVKPADSVAEAQRYIYGRGVHQDCDRGLRMLKSAADHSDAKAMVSLGALYSTGTCAPRDLPTAYRWFAMGLHKEPDNQALQNDLQKLWSQMTQPERQLAIKLSQ